MGKNNYHRLEICIHDKVNIEIISRYKFYISHFKKEYPESFIRNIPAGSARVRFYIDIDNPFKDGNFLYIKENFKGLYSYICMIKNIDKAETEVYFKTPFLARSVFPALAAVFFQAEIMEPIIYLKALENDLLMVHASGVYDARGGYLFAASAKVGKTTTAFHLAAKGFGFLGDDLVFLSKDGMIYSYPKRVHFFPYLKKNNPFLNIGVLTMFMSRIRYTIKNLAWALARKTIYLSTRLDIRKIIAGVELGDKVTAKKIFLLLPPNNADVARSYSDNNYMRIVETCDTRRSLIEGILKYREDMLQPLYQREGAFIKGILSKFNIETVIIKDAVRDADKIVDMIRA